MTNQSKIKFEFSLLVLISIISCISLFNDVWSQQQSPVMVSTRDVIDNITGQESSAINTKFEDILSLLGLNGNNCPGELAIYIHGIWASPQEAEEQTERVYLSLQDINYDIPVIGFSWSSNTDVSEEGWDLAKIIANKNGPLLSKFINGYKEICPNTDIRLVAHSLGSRVTLSALQTLYDDGTYRIIDSVHLLGAAVDDEQISLDSQDCVNNVPRLECSGEAINATTRIFFNLYNPRDNMLTNFFSIKGPYQISENDEALGGFGKEIEISSPPNYNEENVQSYIPYYFNVDYKDANGDGDCDLPVGLTCPIFVKGDNHMGYMGFKDSNGRIVDRGAIEVVVDNWQDIH
ncbi:MAG TPA: DUF726 domain-containing protein [Nitrososphaeraceae archaeon]|nr:DUF726 domain-containing protein [Nitrososphaeraceae archaeon]